MPIYVWLPIVLPLAVLVIAMLREFWPPARPVPRDRDPLER